VVNIDLQEDFVLVVCVKICQYLAICTALEKLSAFTKLVVPLFCSSWRAT